MNLRLAIPSKGRLQEKTFEWFAEHGVELERTGSEREYSAKISGLDGVELVLMSASEIPAALTDGRAELGVTGQDLVHEKLPLWQNQVEEIAAMGFGFADLVLAVPAAWADVETLDDLDDVATDFRLRTKMRLRIATKYHRLVGNFLRKNDVTNFQLIDSQGATEGAVANEYAEMIADITSSGDTIRDNHLKVLGSPILRSQAVLFATKNALNESQTKAIKAVRERLGNTKIG